MISLVKSMSMTRGKLVAGLGVVKSSVAGNEPEQRAIANVVLEILSKTGFPWEVSFFALIQSRDV